MKVRRKKISYYYQEPKQSLFATDDIKALIALHRRSFEYYGWEVVHVDENAARRHKLYRLFDDPNTILNPTKSEYIRSCYMRWLAYAHAGHSFCDYDVINYGFAPKDAEDLSRRNIEQAPLLLSLAGAMGILDAGAYDKLISTFLNFIELPKIEGYITAEVHDLNIISQYHPEWFRIVPYNDDRFVKDFSCDGWHKSKLVHYPYHYTPIPRISTIEKVRPFISKDRLMRRLLSGVIR